MNKFADILCDLVEGNMKLVKSTASVTDSGKAKVLAKAAAAWVSRKIASVESGTAEYFPLPGSDKQVFLSKSDSGTLKAEIVRSEGEELVVEDSIDKDVEVSLASAILAEAGLDLSKAIPDKELSEGKEQHDIKEQEDHDTEIDDAHNDRRKNDEQLKDKKKFKNTQLNQGGLVFNDKINKEEIKENPYDHDSGPNGCAADCKACEHERKNKDVKKARIDEGLSAHDKANARFDRNKPLRPGSLKARLLQGVHKPAYGEHTEPGTSEMGGHIRNPHAMKAISRSTLQSQRALPHPNLPKAEHPVNSPRGDDRGVHKPIFDKGGRSLAGHAASKQHQWANQEHRRVLNESKAMPAPKLPKSELDKAGPAGMEAPGAAALPKQAKMQAAPMPPKTGAQSMAKPRILVPKIQAAPAPAMKSDLDKAMGQRQPLSSPKAGVQKMPGPKSSPVMHPSPAAKMPSPRPKIGMSISTGVMSSGFGKSEKLLVTEDEIYTPCHHCGVPEFKKSEDGSPKFSPCACFVPETVSITSGKPKRFVKLSKATDGKLGLEFDKDADPEAKRLFCLLIKASILSGRSGKR